MVFLLRGVGCLLRATGLLQWERVFLQPRPVFVLWGIVSLLRGMVYLLRGMVYSVLGAAYLLRGNMLPRYGASCCLDGGIAFLARGMPFKPESVAGHGHLAQRKCAASALVSLRGAWFGVAVTSFVLHGMVLLLRRMNPCRGTLL